MQKIDVTLAEDALTELKVHAKVDLGSSTVLKGVLRVSGFLPLKYAIACKSPMVCCFNAPGLLESRLCPPPVISLNPQPSAEICMLCIWNGMKSKQSEGIYMATSAQLRKGSHGSKKRSLFKMASPLTKRRTACRKRIRTHGSPCVFLVNACASYNSSSTKTSFCLYSTGT